MVAEHGDRYSGSSSSTVSDDIIHKPQSTHCLENSHVLSEAPRNQTSTSDGIQNRAPDLEQDSHAQDVDSDSNAESADEDPGCHVQEAQSLLRDARFASRDLLCPWFPEADPSHKRARTLSKRLSRRQSVLTLACLTSWLIFVVNLVATIYLPLRHSDARLFSGSCTTASQLDSGLHVLINGLSSLLLGASNLCMQLLSAPTRNEVDKAHEQKVWLDIGVPSMLRNFKWVATERKIVLVILAVGSLPLHFLWNSALITTQPQNEYFWSVVTPSFLNGLPFDMTAANDTLIARSGYMVEGLYHGFGQPSLNYLTVPDGSGVLPGYGDFLNDTAYVRWLTSLQNEMTALPEIAIEGTLGYEKLSALDCLTRYLTYSRDASNLLLVSSTDIADPANDFQNSNNSLLVFGYYGSPWQSIQVDTPPWECGHSNDFVCVRPETWAGNSTMVANWNVYGYKIDYCLSKTTSLENKCSVRFVLPILIVVCIANLCKCICICYTAWIFRNSENTPLSTLGDAAASFLRYPDHTTESISLASMTNIDTVWKAKLPQEFKPVKHRWYMISKYLWLITMFLGLIVLLPSLILLNQGLITAREELGTYWIDVHALGFGRPSPYEPVSFTHTFIGGIMFANCFQVLVSLLYVQYNALLTAFLVGDEWSRFACTTFDSRQDTIAPQKAGLASEKTDNSPPPKHPQGSTRFASMTKKLRRWLRPATTIYRRICSPAYRTARKALSTSIIEMKKRLSSEPDVRVRKTLRVSSPEGIQRSSYFVSMPFRYGMPLISAMSVLHWLISQSVFVYASDLYKADGTLDKTLTLVTGTGFSLEPIICSIVLGAMFITALVALGFKNYPAGMPLASTCSAAISAACHPPSEDEDAHLFPIQWGVVSSHEGIGHCSLTTARDVSPPKLGHLYA